MKEQTNRIITKMIKLRAYFKGQLKKGQPDNIIIGKKRSFSCINVY